MRIAICAAAFALVATGAAVGKEAPSAASAARDAVVSDTGPAPKTLYVCEDSAMTRRAFAREFGSVQFVTAEAARAKGQAWTAPKCITSVEAGRLKAKRVADAR